jgi:microcystin-dependent protein
MTRKIFVDGDIFYAEDANQMGYPIVDGADILGHGAKVIDDYLADAPDQLKARFYAWYNRFKVSQSTGLTVNVSNGLVNANGTIINIPPQSIVIPNNTTTFIWIGSTIIDPTVALRSSSTLPINSIPLARVVTSSGSITGITDLRNVSVDYLPPSIPDAVPIGSFITSLLPPFKPVPTGYIELQDDPINVSRVIYANLFTEFGTYYGTGDGSTTFTLPGKGNRYIRLNSAAMTPGETGGSDQLSITTSNLPSHSHPILDVSHSHTVNDPQHSHTGSGSPHTHTTNNPPHAHQIYGNTTDGGGDQRRQTDGFSKLSNTAITGEDVGGKEYITNNANGVQLIGNTTTNVTVNSASVSVTVNPSSTGVTLNGSTTGITSTQNTGSGAPITNEPPYLAVRVFVKF